MWREGRRVLSAEWLRWRRSRATLVGALVYIVIIVLIHLGYVISTQHSLIGIETGFFVFGAVLSAATTPLIFMAALFVAFSISREFSHGTIALAWSRPLSRSGWVAGKVISGLVVIGILYALTMAIVMAATGAQFGFERLAEKDFVIHTEPQLWWRLALCAGLTLLGLCAIVMVATVPSLLINSPGGALATMLVLGFVMGIGMSWNVLQPCLPLSYVTQPLDQFVAMAKGLPLPSTWSSLVQTCLLGSAAWGAAGFVASLGLAHRKEIL